MLAAVASITACKREPSFDERYAGAQKAIRDKAGELDRDMATRAADADAIAATASELASSKVDPAILR
jgi:hypothetical protein